MLTGHCSYHKVKYQLVQGMPKEFSRLESSGKQVHMSFCETCGSTLFGRPEIWPDIRAVSASTLDDPSYFSPDVHVWVKDAPKWFTFHSNILKFDRDPT